MPELQQAQRTIFVDVGIVPRYDETVVKNKVIKMDALYSC